MRDIKEKPPDRTPRIMTNTVRVPKELARRSLLSAKEQAQETAAPQQRDESPTEYAESRYTAQDKSLLTGESNLRGKQTTPENSIGKPSSEERSNPVPLFLRLKTAPHGKAGNVFAIVRKAPIGRGRLQGRPLNKVLKRLKLLQKAQSRRHNAL